VKTKQRRCRGWVEVRRGRRWDRRRGVKRGMKPGGRIPEPRVRVAWEGGEGGGGKLHRVEERVRSLLLVWHLLGPTIQRLVPTSLFWLRLQSSGSAGWWGAGGPPVYLGTCSPQTNTGPSLPTGFPLLQHSLIVQAAPMGLCCFLHLLSGISPAKSSLWSKLS